METSSTRPVLHAANCSLNCFAYVYTCFWFGLKALTSTDQSRAEQTRHGLNGVCVCVCVWPWHFVNSFRNVPTDKPQKDMRGDWELDIHSKTYIIQMLYNSYELIFSELYRLTCRDDGMCLRHCVFLCLFLPFVLSNTSSNLLFTLGEYPTECQISGKRKFELRPTAVWLPLKITCVCVLLGLGSSYLLCPNQATQL